jgi:N-carbamoylputrescine amidase
MREVAFAVTQFAATDEVSANLDMAEALVRKAAGQGAQVILLQELFATPYFCKIQDPSFFAAAAPRQGNPMLARFGDLAKELGVVLPISFFEMAGQAHFNSVVMLDADGRDLGLYRKSHIPQNPGYEEKYYFSGGDTGFKVWDTAFGCFGVGICWDQWFPEAARAMALSGAEALLYPTAIGSEPADPGYDSSAHWETVMRGHAGANIMPVMASNRIGTERQHNTEVTFYGSSFIANETGQVMERADRDTSGVLIATFDLDAVAALRRSWGVFRDRRPELYGRLAGMDGGDR